MFRNLVAGPSIGVSMDVQVVPAGREVHSNPLPVSSSCVPSPTPCFYLKRPRPWGDCECRGPTGGTRFTGRLRIPRCLPEYASCLWSVSVDGLIHGSAVPPPAKGGFAVVCGCIGAYPSTLPVLCASPASRLIHGGTVSAAGPRAESGFAVACGGVGECPSTLSALCTSSAPPSDSRVSPGRPAGPGGSPSSDFPRPAVP